VSETTDKPTTFTCQECHKVKERKSMKGPPPKRCEDCKEKLSKEKSRERLNVLRAGEGKEPIPVPEPVLDFGGIEEYDPDAALADQPLPIAPPEESWLDSPEAQELLRQKRQREVDTGVVYDAEVHGSVQDFLASIADAGADAGPGPVDDIPEPETLDDWIDGPTADNPEPHVEPQRPADISSPAAVCIADCGSPYPPHAGLFCGNHWQQVSLEDRGVLLGTQVNSGPFIETAKRAVRRLRS
jgi:hypothetical protein